MKMIQKFVSDDGIEFIDEGQCVKYEVLCKEISGIMSKLAAKPNSPSCEFENGAGYLQHDPIAAKAARDSLLVIANTIMPHKWFQKLIDGEDIHPSYASRLIGEMSEKCLYQAWYRFSCMTPEFREYGQPYFSSNPSEAKDVCLNA